MTHMISSLLLLAPVFAAWLPPAQYFAREYRFHHDNILGTSMELVVRAADFETACEAENVALAEIDRLRRILSTWDPSSEISALNRSTGEIACSAELIDVLDAYETWRLRTGGAYRCDIGGLLAMWRDAEARQILPDRRLLRTVAGDAALPALHIDREAGRIRRLTAQTLNVDSLGKGYIIGRALDAVRLRVSGVSGVLLNIGGDIGVWGGRPWRIAIADPFRPYDNAPPLACISLKRGAVGASGSYERPRTINGQHFSHIIDGRTGWPAGGIVSATVVASDNASANALATTLCILPPDEGLKLARQFGAECLLVAADGTQYRSAGFAAMESSPSRRPLGEEGPRNWPAGFEVVINLTVKPAPRRRDYRPYVAVWAEDAEGRPVRTISLWGNETKYLKELPRWWRIARGRPGLVSAVARATRPPGRYRIVWDGLDDNNKPVPRGTYRIWVESNREKGTLCAGSAVINCGETESSATIPASAEYEEVQITYGPRGGKK